MGVFTRCCKVEYDFRLATGTVVDCFSGIESTFIANRADCYLCTLKL